MKGLRVSILFVFVVLALGCKKDPLPDLPAQNNPYYTIRGLLDGDSISYEVGKENVTIHHGISEMNGIPTYYGNLYSPNDNFSIQLEILRPELLESKEGRNPLPDKTLGFLVHDPGCIALKFGSAYAQYNNFLIKNENNEYVPMEEIEFDEYGIHKVFVKFTDASTISDAFEVPIKYGFESTNSAGGFQSFGVGDSVFIYPYNANNFHQWYIDGQLVSTDDHYCGVMSNGIHEVRHISTDALGNDFVVKTLIRYKDGQYYWQLAYNYCDIIPSENNYGKVMITVIKDGVTYTSMKSAENKDYHFNLDNITYVRDGNYQISWAIYDFLFNAKLYNESQTESLSLTGITGTFNLGLK